MSDDARSRADRDGERFETHARTVAALTFVSRITGLVRDATLSRVFGAGGLMDAFFFAFMIPNLFRRLFGEGALAAAFLPAYARLERDDPRGARRLASALVAMLAIGLGALVLAAELGLTLLLFAGDGERATSTSLVLLAIMLPYAPLVCLVALLGAILQVHRRFGPTAAAPVLLNLAMIGAAVLAVGLGWTNDPAGRVRAVSLVAAGVVAAGIVQLAWSLLALRGSSWWTMHWAGVGSTLRPVLAQAAPMIVGLGVLQLNTFFDGLIASYPTTIGPSILGVAYPLDAGAMASISFAQRLYQFPLGVFGIALATAIFPTLSRQAGDRDAFLDTLKRGLRLVIFIGLPASIGLVLVRGPLVAAILQGGAFSPEDARRVATVLLGYASAVWAYSAIHVITRAFYALGDARTPVRIAVAVVGINLVLNAVLIWTPLREAGLAWSTAICAVLQVTLLARRLQRLAGAVLDQGVLASIARTAALTAAMTLAVAALLAVLGGLRGADAATWTHALLDLVASVVLGGLVIVGGAAFWRMPELGWALRR